MREREREKKGKSEQEGGHESERKRDGKREVDCRDAINRGVCAETVCRV